MSGREILGEPRRRAGGKSIRHAVELLRSLLEPQPKHTGTPIPFKKALLGAGGWKTPRCSRKARQLPGSRGLLRGSSYCTWFYEVPSSSQHGGLRRRYPSLSIPLHKGAGMLPPHRGLPKVRRRNPRGTKPLPGDARESSAPLGEPPHRARPLRRKAFLWRGVTAAETPPTWLQSRTPTPAAERRELPRPAEQRGLKHL